MISACVSWPAAPLTDSLVRSALHGLSVPVEFVNREDLDDAEKPLQWSTYDEVDHELTLVKRDTLLSSAYTFRKALIRKHFLSRIIRGYLTKKPQSILNWACPRTFELEISFADELDEMWADELWELGLELEANSSWWILKPGMADRGMGIRLLHTKADLQSILESFEDHSDTETDENLNPTTIAVSQLRHFVIQEYIQHPLLLDPLESIDKRRGSIGRKFHLRAYCISSGDIKVYLYTRILALFSSAAYTPLDISATGESDRIDLRPHLTNTSLQTEFGDSNVRLLDELEGCHILSGNEEGSVFSRSHIDDLLKQMASVVAEVFRAALQNPVHFQPLPNAFELFGVDFLVSHTSSSDPSPNPFHVEILEINSEPAIELTGPRLNWILVDLFSAIANVCVEPFFAEPKSGKDSCDMTETRHHLLKCLDEKLRPSNS